MAECSSIHPPRFCNRPSPDQTYHLEQLPLSELALQQSTNTMVQAMSLLGSVVQANPKDGEVSFAVYNPCGFARPVGALVTIPHQYLNRLKAYKFRLQSQGTGNAQRLQNGDFVFPYCGIGSMGFATAYLLPEDATPQAPLKPNI